MASNADSSKRPRQKTTLKIGPNPASLAGTDKVAAQPITATQVAALATAAAPPVAPVAKLPVVTFTAAEEQQALSESHQVEPPQEPRGRTSRRRRAAGAVFPHYFHRRDDLTWKSRRSR